MSTTLSLEAQDDLLILTLVPPSGKPPTLDEPLLRDLGGCARLLADAPGEVVLPRCRVGGTWHEPYRLKPRLLVVTSASERYFCVGANLAALAALAALTPERMVPWVQLGHEACNALEDLPIPVIARVPGFALGGGLELALACDLIVAAPGAVFGQPEATLGFIPGWGGTRRLAERVGRAQARRLFFTGERLDAPAAHAAGLVDVLARDGLDPAVAALAAAIRASSGTALAAWKRLESRQREAERQRNARDEAEFSLACRSDPDTGRRLADFFRRRP